MPRFCHGVCASTRFGIDSSSAFPFRTRTHAQSQMLLITLYPALAIPSARVIKMFVTKNRCFAHHSSPTPATADAHADKVIRPSGICDFLCLCVSSLRVRALKEKRLQLATPNFTDIYCMAGPRHTLGEVNFR